MMRLLALTLSALAAVVMVQAFAVAPSALAVNRVPDNTWNVIGTVFATARSENGKTLYIGGRFNEVRSPSGGASVRATNVAAIDVATGAAKPGWRPRVTGNRAIVHSLAVKDGKVFIGGNFSAVNGQPRQNLAAVSAANGSVTSFAPRISKTTKTPYVYALLASDSELYAGGLFNRVEGQRGFANLAAFDLRTGKLDGGWTPRTNNKVRDLEFGRNQASIFVAGRFTHVDGSDGTQADRQSVARFRTDTGNLHPWAIPRGTIDAPQQGWDLTVTRSTLYGGFGSSTNFVAAFHLDTGNKGGQIWRFATVGNVQTIALSPNHRRLFFGGHFGTNRREQKVCRGRYPRGRYLSGLASVNSANGRLYCGWIPQLRPSFRNGNGARSMTTTGGNRLWVGGGFDQVNRTDQRNLARFRL
jgi:hypothetical protein